MLAVAHIVVLFKSYLRAYEAMGLRAYQVIFPLGSGLHQMSYTSIRVAAQESRVPSRTDEFFATVILDLPRATSMDPQARLSASQNLLLSRAFGQAIQTLSQGVLGATLLGLRHGGASHDRSTHARATPEVQSRGNLRDPNTVRRHEMHAGLGRQLQVPSPQCPVRVGLGLWS